MGERTTGFRVSARERDGMIELAVAWDADYYERERTGAVREGRDGPERGGVVRLSVNEWKAAFAVVEAELRDVLDADAETKARVLAADSPWLEGAVEKIREWKRDQEQEDGS